MQGSGEGQILGSGARLWRSRLRGAGMWMLRGLQVLVIAGLLYLGVLSMLPAVRAGVDWARNNPHQV